MITIVKIQEIGCLPQLGIIYIKKPSTTLSIKYSPHPHNNMKELQKVKLNRNTQQRKLEKIRLRWNKYVNVFIGEKLTKDIERLFFEKEPRVDDGSITLHYKGDPWLSGIMRDLGIFKSTSQAKGSGWYRKADYGFFTYIITIRNRPHNITIYKEDKRNLKEQYSIPNIK